MGKYKPQIKKLDYYEEASSTGTSDHAKLTNLAYADSGHTGFEPSLPATPDSPDDKYLDGNKGWRTVAVGSGGFSNNLYLSNVASTDEATYKQLSYLIDASEVIESVVANNDTVLCDTYLFEDGLGSTVIPSGVWRAVLYSKVSSTSFVTTISLQMYLYHADTTETNLFTMTSDDMNHVDYERTVIESSQPAYTCLATDRFGMRLSVTTTRPTNTTVNYKIGDGYAAYFNTTIPTRHKQLRELNEDPEFQHMTSAEKTRLDTAATASVDGYATSTQITKLDGIEAGAEVNNISDVNATDLTDTGATTLHKHSYSNLDDLPTIPVKATGAELDTATDDAKFATAKAIKDAHNVPSVVPGTSGNVLTSDGTDWTSAAAGGGGQTLYDAIVAATGGDYTTLGAAITGGATTIFVREGTYSEGAITSSVANLTIVGANPETTVLNFTTNNLTLSGAKLRMQNIEVSFSTGDATLSGTDSEFMGCHFLRTGKSNDIVWSGAGQAIQNCFIACTGSIGATAFQFNAANQTVTGNHFELNTGSGIVGVYLGNNATKILVSGNQFERTSGTGPLLNANNPDYATITGNVFYDVGTTCVSLLNATKDTGVCSGNFFYGGTLGIGTAKGAITGNNFYGCKGAVVIGGTCTFTGNHLWGAATTAGNYGVSTGTNNNVIVANNFIQVYEIGVKLGAGTDCSVTGNTFDGNTTNISDGGVSTSMDNNSKTAITEVKKFVRMKNTSGVTINAGNIATFNAVAAGNEVTIVSTTQGDPTVFGMAAESIANNAFGSIQTLGKTTLLKVDGTTDIAIGDYITHFTTAGIGCKAAAGNTAIAIALETYTTDDSNGVIDALIISPRIV